MQIFFSCFIEVNLSFQVYEIPYLDDQLCIFFPYDVSLIHLHTNWYALNMSSVLLVAEAECDKFSHSKLSELSLKHIYIYIILYNIFYLLQFYTIHLYKIYINSIFYNIYIPLICYILMHYIMCYNTLYFYNK